MSTSLGFKEFKEFKFSAFILCGLDTSQARPGANGALSNGVGDHTRRTIISRKDLMTVTRAVVGHAST